MTAIRAANAGELTKFRQAGQWSEIYIAGMEAPAVIFAARVNQVFESHANWDSEARDEIMQITYDGVTVGTYTDIIVGMTLWVGSAAGLCDIGQARIRKTPTSSILYFGEESDIDWDDNLYLTVVDEFGLWAKHVKITSGVVYMDGDVVYSDQHSTFDPVPVIGSDMVLDIASYPFTTAEGDLDSSLSWAHGSTISSHAWTASAGSLIDPNTSTPRLTINSYPSGGKIRLKCTTTSAAGKSFAGYRRVHVYDSTHRPEKAFLSSAPTGDYESGGWEFEITMYSDVSSVRDRSPVILFAKDYYNGVRSEIGQQQGRENIVCAGWIDGETIQYNLSENTVTFSVKGAHYWLDRMPGFPPGVAELRSSGAWTSIPSLTVDRAAWHLLHWRSTATAVLDFYKSGDTRYASAFEVPTQSLWAQIKEIAFTSIFANPCCDRYNRLFLEVEPQYIPVDERTWIEVMTLTDVDWEEEIGIKRVIVNPTSLLDASGVAIEAPNSIAKPIFSLATGHLMTRYGDIETIERLLLSTQAQSNELTGLIMGRKNNPFGIFEINLSANNRMIDIAPRQYLNLTIAAGATLRGIEYDGRVIPRAVSLNWDERIGFFQTTITAEPESFPTLAIDGDPPTPVEPPPPSPPPPPPPVPGEPPTGGPHQVLLVTPTHGNLVSLNFHEASPEWFLWNSGLTEDQYQSIIRVKRAPSGLIVLGVTGIPGGPGSLQMRYLFAAYKPGDVWSDILDISMVDQGVVAGEVAIVAFGVNPYAGEQILAVAGGHATSSRGTKYIYMGTSGGFVETWADLAEGDPAVLDDMDLKSGAGDVSYGGGYWIVTADFEESATPHEYYIIKANGELQVLDFLGPPSTKFKGDYPTGASYTYPVWHHRAGTKVFALDGGGEYLRVISGNDPSVEVRHAVDNGDTGGASSLAVDPTGNTLIMAWSLSVPKISTDGGATWSALPAVDGLSSAYDRVVNCGDSSKWIVASSLPGYPILYTEDAGASWIDKTGNLGSVAPGYKLGHGVVLSFTDD